MGNSLALTFSGSVEGYRKVSNFSKRREQSCQHQNHVEVIPENLGFCMKSVSLKRYPKQGIPSELRSPHPHVCGYLNICLPAVNPLNFKPKGLAYDVFFTDILNGNYAVMSTECGVECGVRSQVAGSHEPVRFRSHSLCELCFLHVAAQAMQSMQL